MGINLFSLWWKDRCFNSIYLCLSFIFFDCHFCPDMSLCFFSHQSTLDSPIITILTSDSIVGEFTNSSVVILWSWTSPLGAWFFVGRGQSINWFLAFLCLIVISALIEPFIQQKKQSAAYISDFLLCDEYRFYFGSDFRTYAVLCKTEKHFTQAP